jgi:hypothetical protein
MSNLKVAIFDPGTYLKNSFEVISNDNAIKVQLQMQNGFLQLESTIVQ